MKENQNRDKKFLYPFLAMIIGSIMLIATFFMPFASAKQDQKEHLKQYPNATYIEELNMTNADAINISLFEYARIYSAAAKIGIAKSISIACMVIIFLFGAFALLTLLFSALKKAITAIIFDILAFAVFGIIKWDFADRGVISNSSYAFGAAQCVFYIGAVVVLAGAIAFLAAKIKDKKQNALEK